MIEALRCHHERVEMTHGSAYACVYIENPETCLRHMGEAVSGHGRALAKWPFSILLGLWRHGDR
jgi:hypothetical protein